MLVEKPWLQHYDPGVPHSLAPYPDQPFFAFLERSAQQFPDRACTIFKGRKISYREMQTLTGCMAAALLKLGLRKGERVALMMPNLPQFLIAFFGILKAGGVVVPTSPLYTAHELEHQWQDAGPVLAIISSNYYQLVKQVQPLTPIRKVIVTNPREALPWGLSLAFRLFREQAEGFRVRLQEGDSQLKDLLARSKSQDAPKIEIHGNDLALIQYTGGTTGLSKGAMLSHHNLVANTLQTRAWLRHIKDGEEITLMALPLFHVYGLVVGMSLSIHAAATLVLEPDPRQVPALLASIQRYRITALPGVPTLFQSIATHPLATQKKRNLRSLYLCVSGAAALSQETKKAFEQLISGPLLEGYGLSEAASVTHTNPAQGENRPGSIGLPLPDMDCRVISLEDEITPVPAGEIGELVLRAPQVFQGYWNHPQETAQALKPDQDGGSPWLCTGDVGWMDPDGYFYLVDRKKEMIKASGYQVLPSEVEKVLLSHPAVQLACIAGIPDPYRGETVKAWVVLKAGQRVDADELHAYCSKHLAPYKVPHAIEFRTSLPMNVLGKVLRRVLVEQDLKKTAGEGNEMTG